MKYTIEITKKEYPKGTEFYECLVTDGGPQVGSQYVAFREPSLGDALLKAALAVFGRDRDKPEYLLAQRHGQKIIETKS